MDTTQDLIALLHAAFFDVKSQKPGGLMKANNIFTKLEKLIGTQKAVDIYWEAWERVLHKKEVSGTTQEALTQGMYDALETAVSAWEHPYHDHHVYYNIHRSKLIRDQLAFHIGVEEADRLWQQKYQSLLSLSLAPDIMSRDR